jgi:hypothetical protein
VVKAFDFLVRPKIQRRSRGEVLKITIFSALH